MDPIKSIFGKIDPPPGCGVLCDDPISGLGTFFGVLLNIVLIVFGLLLLTYLIWGAMDWITSEGDKEKKARASAKITNALMGLLVFVISLTLFGIITGNILGFIKKTPEGWQFDIPTVSNRCPGSCLSATQCNNTGGTSLTGFTCQGRCSNPSDCVCCSR